MVKGDKKRMPDFSLTKRESIPEEYTWKVSDIYPYLTNWEKDKHSVIEMMTKINDYAIDWTSKPLTMLQFLSYINKIEEKLDKVHTYASLMSDTDLGNSSWQALKGEIHTISVQFYSQLSFMEPDILKMDPPTIKKYIKEEPRLKVYEKYLNNTLRMASHILSTDKEKLISETALFSRAPQKAAGMLNDLDMPAPRITLSNGEKIKLTPANYVRFRTAKNRKDRVKVMQTYWQNHARFRNTHAILMDGLVKNHFFNAKNRQYRDCLEAALFPYHIDTKVYHNLIQTVKNNLSPLHRYLKLKKQLLNLRKISYDDIYTSSIPAVEKVYSIEEAKDIILEALAPLGEEYISILSQGFNNGWMDIYPNKGKRSGAYSNGSVYDVHPFILMNYNGTFNHVSTLAHEFGHALHSWFSNKNQPFPLSHYPIFLAEIASTFNETLLVQYLIDTETDDLFKLYILDQYLDEFRGTLYRQTLFADFELAIHHWVEQGHTLTPDWLDSQYLELTREFYGHSKGIMEVRKYIENEWSNVPHFYYNFYVYQYSTGIAAANSLAEMVKKGGETERKKYLDFLKSGDSYYPLDILKRTGVDLTTPQPIEKALRKFDEIVSMMESTVQTLEEKNILKLSP